MEILIIAVLIGLIPAAIAQSKGRSVLGFWIYGVLLFIVALPHALLMKASPKAVEKKRWRPAGRDVRIARKSSKVKQKFVGSADVMSNESLIQIKKREVRLPLG